MISTGGGSTIIASLITPQSGSSPAEVEIRMPSDRDTSSYKPGHEGGHFLHV